MASIIEPEGNNTLNLISHINFDSLNEMWAYEFEMRGHSTHITVLFIQSNKQYPYGLDSPIR